LFLPEGGPLGPVGEEVSRGVAIAVGRANDAGGIDGRPLRIAGAASDRLWEGASGELVRLIYDEGAVAVIGALDGRSAHLAEQVITRARGAALFMTPWAIETTLTRIRVPWFFRLVPDDQQQAETLAEEIFITRGLKRVAVWVGDGYDGRAAADAFRRAAPAGAIEKFRAEPETVTPGAAATEEAGIPDSLRHLQKRIAVGLIDAVVLFAPAAEAGEVVAALRAAGHVPPLFGTLALTQPRFLTAIAAAGAPVALVAPAQVAADRFGFERTYTDAHGVAPTLPALYGHDAAAALIEALRSAGPENGDRLASALIGLSLQGVTGELRFNDQGGRDLMPVLATTGEGTPIAKRGDADSTER
jgi:branched-chain amino acid transport system substrate-binding protein